MTKEEDKKSFERKEILFRILIAIISGIVFYVWGYLVLVITVINLFYTLFTGKRNQEFAEICEVWNTQVYTYIRYVTFATNKRPFPFSNLGKKMGAFEK